MSSAATAKIVPDERTFTELFKVHSMFLNIACKIVGAEFSEDAVQEAYMRAWRSREQYRGEASIQTWVSHILVNVCLERQRLAQRRKNLSSNEFVSIDAELLAGKHPESRIISKIDSVFYLNQMKPREREAVMLFLKGDPLAGLSVNKTRRRRGFICACESVGMTYRSVSR